MRRPRVPMRVEDCPVKATSDVFSGKWKPLILFYLKEGPVRFGQLRRLTLGASHKVLSEQLRELEDDGIISRVSHPGKPLKVEYSLTNLGLSLAPILGLMAEWGTAFRALQARKAEARQHGTVANDNQREVDLVE